MRRHREEVIREIMEMGLGPRQTAIMIALAEFQNGLPLD
jgi:hypothetical protein